jgi:hypothetical protein
MVLVLIKGREITQTVQLKGGMIFNKEGAAQINQDYVQYTRKVDTTALHNIAQQLHAYMDHSFGGLNVQRRPRGPVICGTEIVVT